MKFFHIFFLHIYFHSVEAFDVFCFGQLLYEISVGRPLNHVQVSTFTSNNVNDSSYNTAVLEGNEAIPNQLPDSLSKLNYLGYYFSLPSYNNYSNTYDVKYKFHFQKSYFDRYFRRMLVKIQNPTQRSNLFYKIRSSMKLL